MSEIRAEQLTKTFGSLHAVDDVSFTFPSGQVTCLLGPSGCGKTTLMRIIAGLETQTSGAVYFGDRDVSRLSPSKRNIGMVFQYPVVYRGISVYRNIELPLQSMKLSKAERTRRVEDAIQLLGLTASANLDVSKLDNGTRQKVSVAREVARQPQFILFDEPITNVDAASKLQLKRSLKELTRSLSQTIVYVTHDQTEAMTLADQIALMEEGRIVQCAPPRELYNHPYDRFGGWFLGNPGMAFFAATLCHTLGRWKPPGAGVSSLPAPGCGQRRRDGRLRRHNRHSAGAHPGLGWSVARRCAGAPRAEDGPDRWSVSCRPRCPWARQSGIQSQSLSDRGRALALIGTGQRRVAAGAGVALRRARHPDRGQPAPGRRPYHRLMARPFLFGTQFKMNQTPGLPTPTGMEQV
jgi:ABC-type sugar transport system ATPase subunit